ncbi:hypothetical protein [Neolewinella persica]|uniref:hypothetical protein n=1 Tax=Neolewinella persica TaxID=70998 RepID=UPI00036EA7DA|nr:hypothetical protein [Neolewinella persica]
MSETPTPPDWEDLVDSIRDGEAILVLGPDAIPYYRGAEQTSFSELARTRVQAEVGEGIGHFYERDNLFQFRDAKAKRRARKCIREVARTDEWQPDAELLRQIVAIPFPVILNLNPDKRVWDAFVTYWREPQFDYFTTHDKPELKELAYPNGKERPLLYNLAGSALDKMDSTVLDYHDLFDRLKYLLSDTGVPRELTDKLREADHFVLLGVELERWYLQLFLHYINQLDSPFNNYNQNYPILCDLSDNNRQFILKQFNITHQSLSREDFSDIHAACAASPGLLRELTEPDAPAAIKVRQLLIAGDFEQAFTALKGVLLSKETTTTLPLLQGQYRDYLKTQQNGTASAEDLRLVLNRIRYALLSLVTKIPVDG